MPPLQALLALHAFWLVVLAPPVVLAARLLRARYLLLIGLGVTLLALASLTYILYAEVFRWCQEYPELSRHWSRRLLFVVLTQADLPGLQLLLAGLVFLVAGIKGAKKENAKKRHEAEFDSPNLNKIDASNGPLPFSQNPS